ncbi:lysophospholipid acyltransferase family protein [Mucilaginibacter terrae]|uniref:lysophospholipid acyltransferase family protein n=1 Tax=Mucilaginibacter terrae TaxID=1955052 RepID=UPI00363FB287
MISKHDFSKATGTTGMPGLAPFLMRLMKIDAFNKLMDNAAGLEGVAFADYLLKTLGISIEINNSELDNIPKHGAFIVVANHPYGAIESLALLSILVKQRPETMFMGNFLLKKVPNLADYIIAVNPFESIKHSSSISGLKNTIRMLKDGIPVAIFPAGEVSSYDQQSKQITDKPWHPIVGKIIAKANVPVVPIYFHGNNGLWFSLLRYIHPSLQTAMLPTELFNKKGHVLRVCIGQPVLSAKLNESRDSVMLLEHLRHTTYALANAGSS